jgi:hypothetical protein
MQMLHLQLMQSVFSMDIMTSSSTKRTTNKGMTSSSRFQACLDGLFPFGPPRGRGTHASRRKCGRGHRVLLPADRFTQRAIKSNRTPFPVRFDVENDGKRQTN